MEQVVVVVVVIHDQCMTQYNSPPVSDDGTQAFRDCGSFSSCGIFEAARRARRSSVLIWRQVVLQSLFQCIAHCIHLIHFFLWVFKCTNKNKFIP